MCGSTLEFSILDWLDRLQPAGRAKSRYICPNCGGNNLSVNLRSGAYRCYSGCENPEVREAIRPLAEALQEAGIAALDSREELERRAREREFKRQQRQKEKLEHRTKLLSIEERARQFRLLHRQAGHPATRHVRHLVEKRQLIQADIDLAIQQGWIWTWLGGEKIPFGVTPDLPGVSDKGNLRSFAGFVIAALDPDGRITGLQIANDNRNPKYQWISSSGVGGNGPHLPNGELPLFCWKHPEVENIVEVWLCEGALKSLLTALFLWRMGRTDIAVIGTASAAVYGEQTLQDYLERLKAKDIKLMPDAGAISNKQIHNANKSTLEVCSSWGYQVSVGWWGQSSKEDFDIDELLSQKTLSNCLEISYCTSDEYIALSQIELPSRKDREITKEQWQGIEAFRTFQDLYALICGNSNKQPKEVCQKELDRGGAIVLYRGPGVLKYEQPGDLPTFSEWVEMGRPEIRYDSGLRIQCYKEAYQKGWADILDSSLVGKGKSHDSGLLSREDFDLSEYDAEGNDIGGRIFHLSADHKNPTTLTVEQNSFDLIGRHNGESLDYKRLTPAGNPYRTRTPQGGTPDIPGNCPETNTFLIAFQEKDTFIHGGKGSAICERCHLFENCGFLTQRREQLAGKYNLRAHPNQLGNAVTPKDIAIVDEPGTLLEPTKTVTLNRSDISVLFPTLRERDRKTYDLLYKFLCLISDALGNALDAGIPKHGLSHTETLAWLGNCWGTTDEDKFRTDIWQRYQKLGERYEHPVVGKLREALENMSGSWGADDPWSIPTIQDLKQQLEKALKNNWDKIFQGCQTPEEKQQAIRNEGVLNSLGYFIDAVTGQNDRIDIRIDNGQYVITCRSKRHQQTIDRAKFRIYTDATIGVVNLRQITGKKDILEICEYVPDDSFANLTVKVVKGLGTNPKGTTADTTVARYKAAVNGAIAQSGLDKERVALLTFKNSLEIFQDLDIKKGYWYRDSRGNNRFTSINLLILHGLPKPNLGDMASQWHALTGKTVNPTKLSGSYGYWYWQQVMAEMVQALGRPRAHLRPNDRIEVTILAGDAMADRDIATIKQKFPGCTVEIVEAYDLAPEAASKGNQKKRGIVELAWELVQQGIKPSLEAIAKSLNTTDKSVSKHAKTICDGGFKRLVKNLLFLFNALKEKVEFKELDEDTQHFAQCFLPLLAKDLENPKHLEGVMEGVASVTESFPAKQVRRILAATPPWALCKLIGAAFKLTFDRLIDKPPPITHSSSG